MFIDPSGLYTAGITLAGLTKYVTNVESKATGWYASLRSLSEYSGKDCNLTWEEKGDGAVATFSPNSGNYTVIINFDSREAGTYASSVEYVYTAGGKSINITNAMTNSVRDKIENQDAYFYLKDDEKGNGIVVMSKITTTLFLNKVRSIEKYLSAVIELSEIDAAKSSDVGFQEHLDKWSKVDLLNIDTDKIIDAYNAKNFSFKDPSDIIDWIEYNSKN